MPRRTPVSEIMTSHLRTVDAGAKLSEVRRVLSEGRFHHVPVVDDGVLVGIVSTSDLLRVYRAGAATTPEEIDERLDGSATLAETMSTDLVTLRADDPVERAIECIAEGQLHSVLVLDAESRLVGIVTDTDLLDYLRA